MSLLNIAVMSKENESARASPPGPLLVFVLGKITLSASYRFLDLSLMPSQEHHAPANPLCAALAKRYNLDHFSLGDELRSLVSDTPSGHATRIKPLFSTVELETFRNNLYAGTLGPIHLMPKYVKERVFPAGCIPQDVRMLIDGFPRDAERWVPFKEFAEAFWTPSKRSVLIVLDVEMDVALQRFTSRGRPGDVFDRRFDEHTKLTPEIVEAMKKDQLTVLTLEKEQNGDVEATVNKLGGLLS